MDSVIKEAKRKLRKKGFGYILDLLCYAYYVKSDNLVSDTTFDELEKLYCKLTGEKTAPNRAMERAEAYTNGVKFMYSISKLDKRKMSKMRGE